MMDGLVNLVNSVALFLEREAGHSTISLFCIWVGMLYLDPVARSQMAHDVALIGIGYLGRGMGSAKQ
jgi:hypothetical protein